MTIFRRKNFGVITPFAEKAEKVLVKSREILLLSPTDNIKSIEKISAERMQFFFVFFRHNPYLHNEKVLIQLALSTKIPVKILRHFFRRFFGVFSAATFFVRRNKKLRRFDGAEKKE